MSIFAVSAIQRGDLLVQHSELPGLLTTRPMSVALWVESQMF
jgi:hypothetical protein